jgi:histidyl-tRNA synthetase
VLVIELSRPIKLELANRPSATLAAGFYLYCGSAKGPGGLQARIARHMRRGKRIHWHFDNLTKAGCVLGAWAIVDGHECQLVAALSHLPMPIEGFGSSDCLGCKSHLMRWPGKSMALLHRSLRSVLSKPTHSVGASIPVNVLG